MQLIRVLFPWEPHPNRENEQVFPWEAMVIIATRWGSNGKCLMSNNLGFKIFLTLILSTATEAQLHRSLIEK